MVRWVALGLGLLSIPAFATTMVAMDLTEQAAESDALVVAVVGSSTTVVTERMPYTDTELRVVEVRGGEAPATFRVRQAGGDHDGKRTRIPGDARLVEGERIVAFVREIRGHWYFTALGQSVWHVRGEGPSAPLSRDVQGMHFFERDPRGAVVPATQSLPEYATLGELSAASRGLAFGDAP